LAEGVLVQAGLMSRRPASVPARRSSLAGFRFPPDVIMLAVRWYLRYGLSYRDVEELLAERRITVDHVTIYRWVQRFTPELIDAARPSRHVAGDRWFVDETYLKLAGRWVYLYRAIDQHGQVIDVLASPKRDLAATRRFFARAIDAAQRPTEVTPTGPGLPAGPRRARARGLARRGAVRQQPHRIRPRSPEGSDPSDARLEAAPLRPGGL
jgi:transposase-like protein